ncbi:MAG: methylenetetrahydrofolate reductase [Acidimicrobiales bacterium]|nr:methylenetetrahydrofolate reductase [Acidimicrobiales bacterium]
MADLVARLHYELVPMRSIEAAIAELPAGAPVSVTCSPAAGIPATLDYCSRLIDLGHQPIPHLAARTVADADAVEQTASWLRQHQIREVFVIAGDAPEPAGPYEGAAQFMADLIAAEPGVDRIGIAGYPDGHPAIDDQALEQQLFAKQALLRSAGLDGWISTQMCFDATRVRAWLQGIRAAGMTLPVRLGVPGVVDRARLLKVGTRIGIGASLRYVSKNRSTVMRLMSPGGYDPTDLVAEFADDAQRLGIEALHSFTFNSVADTARWQAAIAVAA